MPGLLRLTCAETSEAFEIELYEGLDSAALAHAVSARTGYHRFWLTKTTNRSGAVVPLSPSLADGTALVVHCADAPQKSVPNQRCHGTVHTNTTTSTSNGMHAPLLPLAASSINSDPRPPLPPLEGLERLSRLTTELANERTLLAWTRTCLAAIRTLFAYLALHGVTAGWSGLITACEVLMSLVVVATAAFGSWRFFKIKDIILLKVPPPNFGRFSIRPLAVLVLLTAMATVTGACSQQWRRH